MGTEYRQVAPGGRRALAGDRKRRHRHSGPEAGDRKRSSWRPTKMLGRSGGPKLFMSGGLKLFMGGGVCVCVCV